MENEEVNTGHTLQLVNLVEYIPNSVVTKTILKKITGHINAVSLDKGEITIEMTIPFDTFIQIIDGKGEIVIDETSNILETGQGIIVPAHSSSFAKAPERFKMILTTIKSGYE